MTLVFDSTHDALQAHFNAQVTSLIGLPTGFDNMPFSPPDQQSYAKFFIAWGPTEMVEWGKAGNRYRTDGLAIGSAFAPVATGDALSLSYGRRIAAAFRGQQLGQALVLSGLSVIRVGVQGKFWRTNVHIPFRVFDTEKPATPAQEVGDTTLEGVGKTLRNRFRTLVADPNSLPVLYDNSSADVPPDATTMWARWAVRFGEEVEEIGGANRSTFGMATAQIFAKAGEGTDAALRLAGDVVSAFRSVTDRGVTLLSPSLDRTGRSGVWWQINVRCPFYFEAA